MGLKENIKKRRLELDMTLDEVAKKIGVQKPTVQRYESGKIEKISTVMIERLATALETTPAYLMGWTESPDGGVVESGDFVISDGQIFEYDKLNDENKKKLEDYFRLLMLEQMSKEGEE